MNHFSNNFHLFSNREYSAAVTIHHKHGCFVPIYRSNCFNFGLGFQWGKFLRFVRKMVKENGALLSRWKKKEDDILKLWRATSCAYKKEFSIWEYFSMLKNYLFQFIWEQNNFFINSSEQHWMQVMKKRFFLFDSKNSKAFTCAFKSFLLFYQRIKIQFFSMPKSHFIFKKWK